MTNDNKINLRPDFSAKYINNIAKHFEAKDENSSDAVVYTIPGRLKKNISKITYFSRFASIVMIISGLAGIVYAIIQALSGNIASNYTSFLLFGLIFCSGVIISNLAAKTNEVLESNSQDSVNYRLSIVFENFSLLIIALASFSLVSLLLGILSVGL